MSVCGFSTVQSLSTMELATFGDTLSVRGYARIAAGLSVFGASRTSAPCSVFDYLALGCRRTPAAAQGRRPTHFTRYDHSRLAAFSVRFVTQ